MNEEQWRAAWSLYQAAGSLSGDEVRRLLESAESPEIRAAVIRLLEAGGDPDTRTLGADHSSSYSTSSITAGAVIGRYQLIQKLGEGGMGEVWLAEQKEPVSRRVALKLIKSGMSSREVSRRFESERQALAIMDHPAIAKVFDAGSTPEGMPYFVMEYASGEPITAYCDNRRLTTHNRLELFRQVCEAVQHAHQKAIIHRDLKPSNILVTEVDGRAMPKVIDFGIAKALKRDLPDETAFTRMGAIVGTPEYMSPEQALMSGEDIDTRTDVYSLGVVFYELLVGATPIDLKRVSVAEFFDRLRSKEPPRPSTRVATQDAVTSTEVARRRQTEPATLARQLEGDLDSIALKALEKDRERRYSTPLDFAADIQRYLHHEPVSARRGSTAYRTRKYIRRHAFGAAVTAAAVLLFIGFAVAQAAQLRRTTRERDRANRITDFMLGIFRVSDPSQAKGNTITARELIDKAAADIDRGLARDPEVQAQMLHVMGNVYGRLGLYPRAETLASRALDLRRRVLGPEDPDTLDSMTVLSAELMAQGRYTEAEKVEREAIAVQKRVLGPNDPRTIDSQESLASIFQEQGRYGEAEGLQRDLLPLQIKVLGADHPKVCLAQDRLSMVLERQGRLPEAEKIQRQVLDTERRVLGPDDPATLDTMEHLGWTLYGEGRYAEAEKIQRESLDLKKRVLGPEHPHTLVSLSDLAATLMGEGRLPEAEKLFRETAEIQARVIGPEDPKTLSSANNLGAVLMTEGRLDEAEKIFKRNLEIQRRTVGEGNPETSLSLYNLGAVKAHQGKKEEALAALKEAVDHGLSPALDLGMDTDPDLNNLHGDPRFDALVAHAKARAREKSKMR
jgi:non-specific serine/threonine protein kinase/serine/threonine-protein kinase